MDPEPRHATRPAPGCRTLGHRVEFAARLLGTPLMPHQRRIVDTALQVDGHGRPIRSTVVVTIPRQSGKTALMSALMLGRALSERDFRIWYTAQTGLAARKKFRDLSRSVKASPLGRQMPGLLSYRSSAGDECISIGTSSVSIFSPQPDALHGETIDLVCIDEAWSFTAERGTALLQAAMPAQATRPRAQTWIVSTAGDSGSEWLKELVARGREAAQDPRSPIAYFEWSADVPEGAADADAVRAVLDAHPAAGRTIDRRFIAAQLDELGRDQWLRAYGNCWTTAAIRVIPAVQWAAALLEVPPPAAGPAVLAIDVTPQRDHTAIACAWTHGGRPHTAIAAHAEGTDWAAAEAARIAARLHASVVIDDGSAASTMIQPLRRAGARVRTITGRDIARACGEFYDDVMHGAMTIGPDPALNDAAAGALQRTFADAWAWGRRASASDISPLCAATWAAWGLRHAESGPIIV